MSDCDYESASTPSSLYSSSFSSVSSPDLSKEQAVVESESFSAAAAEVSRECVKELLINQSQLPQENGSDDEQLPQRHIEMQNCSNDKISSNGATTRFCVDSSTQHDEHLKVFTERLSSSHSLLNSQSHPTLHLNPDCPTGEVIDCENTTAVCLPHRSGTRNEQEVTSNSRGIRPAAHPPATGERSKMKPDTHITNGFGRLSGERVLYLIVELARCRKLLRQLSAENAELRSWRENYEKTKTINTTAIKDVQATAVCISTASQTIQTHVLFDASDASTCNLVQIEERYPSTQINQSTPLRNQDFQIRNQGDEHKVEMSSGCAEICNKTVDFNIMKRDGSTTHLNATATNNSGNGICATGHGEDRCGEGGFVKSSNVGVLKNNASDKTVIAIKNIRDNTERSNDNLEISEGVLINKDNFRDCQKLESCDSGTIQEQKCTSGGSQDFSHSLVVKDHHEVRASCKSQEKKEEAPLIKNKNEKKQQENLNNYVHNHLRIDSAANYDEKHDTQTLNATAGVQERKPIDIISRNISNTLSKQSSIKSDESLCENLNHGDFFNSAAQTQTLDIISRKTVDSSQSELNDSQLRSDDIMQLNFLRSDKSIETSQKDPVLSKKKSPIHSSNVKGFEQIVSTTQDLMNAPQLSPKSVLYYRTPMLQPSGVASSPPAWGAMQNAISASSNVSNKNVRPSAAVLNAFKCSGPKLYSTNCGRIQSSPPLARKNSEVKMTSPPLLTRIGDSCGRGLNVSFHSSDSYPVKGNMAEVDQVLQSVAALQRLVSMKY